VSPCLNNVVRVAEVPESVTSPEVNLILWLILEREFGTVYDSPIRSPLTPVAEGGFTTTIKEAELDSGDSVDSVSDRRGSIGYSRRQRERRKSISQHQKARKCMNDFKLLS